MNCPLYRFMAGCLAALFVLIATEAIPQSLQFTTVSRSVIEARLKTYAVTNAGRATALEKLFGDAGCDSQHLSDQLVNGSKLPNIVCTWPGSSDKVIIVGAHFDHVSEGDGVVDNWSGASLLPSLFEAIKSEPRQHTYIFIGFTDEERGEVGSRFYAQKMTKEQVATIEAMVNMDTLGLAPTKVWVSHSDKHLSGLLAYLAKKMNIPAEGVNVDQVGSSDSVQFSERKIPSITVHSLTQETYDARILHTAKDKFAAIHLDDYNQTYKLLAAYLVFLDESLGRVPVAPASRE